MADGRGGAGEASAGRLALGLDVGGTKIGFVLLGETGEVVGEHRIPTEPDRGAARALDAAAAAAREAFGAAMERVGTVGVAVAGQVAPGGVLAGAPNLAGWAGAPLAAEAERAFARPAAVLNDVRAATWAEWRFGAGRGADDLVVVFVGTGVGGGAVCDGRMLEGADGILGEFGHATLVAGGRACHCRNRGCLEAYCGGWAIGERAREAALVDPAAGAALLRLTGGAVDDITAATVSAARAEGDVLAREIVRETGEMLGYGLVSLVNGLNPRRVILGGGVLDGLPELLDLASDVVRAHALPAALQGLEIRRAALGDAAPAIGAAEAGRALRSPSAADRPAPGTQAVDA